jgi:hypothetical protein
LEDKDKDTVLGFQLPNHPSSKSLCTLIPPFCRDDVAVNCTNNDYYGNAAKPLLATPGVNIKPALTASNTTYVERYPLSSKQQPRQSLFISPSPNNNPLHSRGKENIEPQNLTTKENKDCDTLTATSSHNDMTAWSPLMLLATMLADTNLPPQQQTDVMQTSMLPTYMGDRGNETIFLMSPGERKRDGPRGANTSDSDYDDDDVVETMNIDMDTDGSECSEHENTDKDETDGITRKEDDDVHDEDNVATGGDCCYVVGGAGNGDGPRRGKDGDSGGRSVHKGDDYDYDNNCRSQQGVVPIQTATGTTPMGCSRNLCQTMNATSRCLVTAGGKGAPHNNAASCPTTSSFSPAPQGGVIVKDEWPVDSTYVGPYSQGWTTIKADNNQQTGNTSPAYSCLPIQTVAAPVVSDALADGDMGTANNCDTDVAVLDADQDQTKNQSQENMRLNPLKCHQTRSKSNNSSCAGARDGREEQDRKPIISKTVAKEMAHSWQQAGCSSRQQQQQANRQQTGSKPAADTTNCKNGRASCATEGCVGQQNTNSNCTYHYKTLQQA